MHRRFDAVKAGWMQPKSVARWQVVAGHMSPTAACLQQTKNVTLQTLIRCKLGSLWTVSRSCLWFTVKCTSESG